MHFVLFLVDYFMQMLINMLQSARVFMKICIKMMHFIVNVKYLNTLIVK